MRPSSSFLKLLSSNNCISQVIIFLKLLFLSNQHHSQTILKPLYFFLNRLSLSNNYFPPTIVLFFKKRPIILLEIRRKFPYLGPNLLPQPQNPNPLLIEPPVDFFTGYVPTVVPSFPPLFVRHVLTESIRQQQTIKMQGSIRQIGGTRQPLHLPCSIISFPSGDVFIDVLLNILSILCEERLTTKTIANDSLAG